MKRLVVLLGMLAAFAITARADGFVEVAATGTFTGENWSTMTPSLLAFSMSFEYDTTTMQGVPGTMVFAESDTVGLGPFFTPLVGQSFTSFFNSTGVLLQVGINEYGCCIGPQWPDVGRYGSNDVLLLCQQSAACYGDFNSGYLEASNGGVVIRAVEPTATPEPNSLLLLLVGLAAMALQAGKKIHPTRSVSQNGSASPPW